MTDSDKWRPTLILNGRETFVELCGHVCPACAGCPACCDCDESGNRND